MTDEAQMPEVDPKAYIRFLTTVLDRCSFGRKANLKSPSGTIAPFIHFANLLTLKSSILAVTGKVALDASFVAILVSDGKGSTPVDTLFKEMPLVPSHWRNINFDKSQ